MHRIADVISGAIRSGNEVLDPVSGLFVPATLLERTSTNLIPQSENLALTWSTQGTPVVTADVFPVSNMGVRLDQVADDDPAASEYVYRVPNYVGDGDKAVSVFTKEPSSPAPQGSQIQVRDFVLGINRLRFVITWAAGVPTVTVLEGTLRAVIPYGFGVYRILGTAVGVVAANTHRFILSPTRTDVVGELGNALFGGAQTEDVAFPSSYIRTTGAAVTRVDEYLSYPFNFAPQDMSIYCKFYERGTAYMTTAQRLWQVGGNGGATPRLVVSSHPTVGTGYRITHNVAATVETSGSPQPAFGDRVEVVGRLYPDGSVDLLQSINGGAVTTQLRTGALAFGLAWAAPTLFVNSSANGNQGQNAFAPNARGELVTVRLGVHDMTKMRAAFAEA